MHHIPHYLVASRYPTVFVDCLVSIYLYEVVVDRQRAVEVGCLHLDSLVLFEKTCRVFHYGKYLGQYFVEFMFVFVEYFLL